ncbi:MAG: class I SAM-dependent methyltransferase [Thaumarchaeota archaeon]|nr:class I SAM-dependent methyltransferase [Nitrososphaerota archaeon]
MAINVQALIRGSLDSPANRSRIFTPFLQIKGWAISENRELQVKILVDDIVIDELEPKLTRNDVVRGLGVTEHTVTPGFTSEVDVSKLSDGIHNVKAIAYSGDDKLLLGSVFVQLLISKVPQYTEELRSRSLERWKKCKPDPLLTWGKKLTGDEFIKTCGKYANFSTEKSILELGPGYGRILSSIISKNIPFKSYTGVDLSENNISELQKNFETNKIHFVHGNFTTVQLKEKFDVVVSSLTLKHQYPTFANAIKNISKNVKNGGLFIFDLLENTDMKSADVKLKKLLDFGPTSSTWEETGTFVGFYTTEEVLAVLRYLQLEFVAFDYVVHWPETGKRLVVVARKTDLVSEKSS